MSEGELDRMALAVLQPGFEGTEPPAWLRRVRRSAAGRLGEPLAPSKTERGARPKWSRWRARWTAVRKCASQRRPEQGGRRP